MSNDLGQRDYGYVRDCNGNVIVDVYACSHALRKELAIKYFEEYRYGKIVDAAHIVSYGSDIHDPVVERFHYIGPR